MLSENFPISNNFEEESDPLENGSDYGKIYFDELNNSAVYQSTDWTIVTLLDQIARGRILLSPSFQRRDAWDEQRKSRFIESLVMNFPIPQLVLAEMRDQKGKYIVIDGKQRLLTLVQFAGKENINNLFNTLRLKGLDILIDLNSFTYEELQKNNITNFNLEDFENRTIRTVVIKNWKNESILYHIFLRLNTGSVPLSPQELRNALHPGDFAEYIDKYSGESPALRRILHSKGPDFRMRDAELLLRYFAFRNFLDTYSGSMKSFLDETTRILNKKWIDSSREIEIQGEQFERAVNITYDVFGDANAFRKWKNGFFVDRFNRAVFDIMMFTFWHTEIESKIKQNKKIILDSFIELSDSNSEFMDSIESTTKSLGATVTRLALWVKILNKKLQLGLPQPELIDNKIIINK